MMARSFTLTVTACTQCPSFVNKNDQEPETGWFNTHKCKLGGSPDWKYPGSSIPEDCPRLKVKK